MIKVICINDKGRPSDIPLSKWIVKDEPYTVINAIICKSDGGKLGYQLEEIDLTPYAPYICFAASRFKVIGPVEKKVEMEELLEVA